MTNEIWYDIEVTRNGKTVKGRFKYVTLGRGKNATDFIEVRAHGFKDLVRCSGSGDQTHFAEMILASALIK